MKSKVVNVPSVQQPIAKCPGFAKKQLADFKLDRIGLCESGCLYCSSNSGNNLRINQEPFADLTEAQTGERTYPSDDPGLTFAWPDFQERLDAQLAKKHPGWCSREMTLVYSMLTDGFSPTLVRSGQTEETLRAVLKKTPFRIRVLTKNAIVGKEKWLGLFKEHADRFVIGLSTGSMDDKWAKKVELLTAPPSRRWWRWTHCRAPASPPMACSARSSPTCWKATSSSISSTASVPTSLSTFGRNPTTTARTGKRSASGTTRVAPATSG